MCGACGRVVVPDDVLGPMRTLRQHLVVAQVVNEVCRRLPGVPRVTALADGWLITEATGKTRVCRTVEETWFAVIAAGADRPSRLDQLREEFAAHARAPVATGLSARVVDVGRALVARLRDSLAPRH